RRWLGSLGWNRSWARVGSFARRRSGSRRSRIWNCGNQFQIRSAGLVANFHALRRVEFKDVFIGLERLPFDPALEGRFVQSAEELRGQLEIISVPGQRQHPL